MVSYEVPKFCTKILKISSIEDMLLHLFPARDFNWAGGRKAGGGRLSSHTQLTPNLAAGNATLSKARG